MGKFDGISFYGHENEELQKEYEKTFCKLAIKGKQFQRTEDGHLILMSNEERNLLITDLTARINYGVICLIERVDDFGNETHLHNYKPRFKTDAKYPKVDFGYEDSLYDTMDYDPWSIHVSVEGFDMKAGDGPIPVTLEILS